MQTAGGIELGGLTVLADLSAPQLTKVDTLNFTALPALQSLSFGNKGITEAISILITNTGLGSLSGINNLNSIETFDINNNQALTNISLDIKQIKKSLVIDSNDGYVAGLSVLFPSLENALNMTFRNCSSIELPSLSVVNQSLGFYGNSFESFAASNLTSAGGLIFVDNTELTNISLPMLKTITQAYQIANNTQLKRIDGFQKLSTVAGALDFSGNFTEYVLQLRTILFFFKNLLTQPRVELPALSRVSGAFNLQSSSELDCSAFDKDHTNKVIRGNYTCQGKVTKPGGADTVPSGTGSSPSSTAAASNFDPKFPAMVGGSSLIAGLLQLLL